MRVVNMFLNRDSLISPRTNILFFVRWKAGILLGNPNVIKVDTTESLENITNFVVREITSKGIGYECR